MTYLIHGKTSDWELVIGLETHMQVTSNAKLFSGASADYTPKSIPNDQVDFIDAAFPGMLPTPNRFCIDQAIRMGLGINAEINLKSIFARKNYFYADLASGYQITQTTPIVGNGYLDILDEDNNTKRIRIERIHLEQDAGKNKHDQNPTKSFVDFNRAGVALMEIVSFPDISSPVQAANYLRGLQAIARALKTSDGNMEAGSMRADVNVSVRRVGETEFRTRCEIKNMTSFSFIQSAIEFEANRQVEIYENGGVIDQETRRYHPDINETSTLRSKENALDYRYFPDPDLLPLILTSEYVENIRKSMPELPAAKRNRFISEYGLSEYDANILTMDMNTAEWFEKSVNGNAKSAKPIANWMISELFAHLNKSNETLLDCPIKPEHLSELVELISTDVISGKIAKTVFAKMLEGDGEPSKIVEKHGLKQVTDTSAIDAVIDELIASNPDSVSAYKNGKTALIGWFVGQVMQKTGGRANPGVVNQLLTKKLNG